jgi:hypothetical protein
MAKSANRGAGPGTHLRGGVRSTMDPPFKGGAGKGTQVNMSGKFDHARSGGDNGLPTRVQDRTGGPKAGGKGPASENSSLGPIKTSRRSNSRSMY